MDETTCFRFTPETIRGYAWRVAIVATIYLSIYAWLAAYWLSQIPPANPIYVQSGLLFGGLLVVLELGFGIASYVSLRANPPTITFGENWVDLLGGDRIRAAEIDRVQIKNGVLHRRIQVRLKRRRLFRRETHIIYPHQYGVMYEIDKRLISLWKQQEIADNAHGESHA